MHDDSRPGKELPGLINSLIGHIERVHASAGTPVPDDMKTVIVAARQQGHLAGQMLGSATEFSFPTAHPGRFVKVTHRGRNQVNPSDDQWIVQDEQQGMLLSFASGNQRAWVWESSVSSRTPEHLRATRSPLLVAFVEARDIAAQRRARHGAANPGG